jgi:hypothetical protein
MSVLRLLGVLRPPVSGSTGWAGTPGRGTCAQAGLRGRVGPQEASGGRLAWGPPSLSLRASGHHLPMAGDCQIAFWKGWTWTETFRPPSGVYYFK